MRVIILTIFIYLIPQYGKAQKHEFGVVFGCGTGFFSKNNYLNNKVSNNRISGVFYTLNNKSNTISFNPSVSFTDDLYYIKLPLNSYCEVKQNKVGLYLDVIMKFSKKVHIRAGINFNKIFNSEVGIRYNPNEIKYPFFSFSNSDYWYSNTQTGQGYSYNSYQMGIRGGICFPFIFSRLKMKLNIIADQSASNIVTKDYDYTNPDGTKTKILSEISRPTKLFLILEINFKRIPKKKDEMD